MTEAQALAIAEQVYYGVDEDRAHCELDTDEMQRIYEWVIEGSWTDEEINNPDIPALVREWSDYNEED